jgi:DNA polymerase-3 subunit delta'
MFDDFDDDIGSDDDFESASQALFADEPDGLVEPRLSKECVGFEDVEKQLLSMFDKGTFPHAVMFTGPQGIGKATFSHRLARFLLSQQAESADGGLFGDELPKESPQDMNIDPEGNVFRQMAAGSHPDFLVIGRKFDEKKGAFKGGVEVDDVRKITPFLRRTASQGGWRAVIVDDADTMNRSSQNAILKILEEPPSNTVLILVVHRAGAMIPTIRSRCRSFVFKAPEFDVFSALLKRENASLSVDELEVLYNISGGSVGRALAIAGEGGLIAMETLKDVLERFPEWDWTQIHDLSDSLSRPGQEKSAQAFKDIFKWSMESILRAKARGEILRAPLDNEAMQKMMDYYSLEDWIKICENITQHFDLIEKANLDKKQMVFGVFSLFDIKKAA